METSGTTTEATRSLSTALWTNGKHRRPQFTVVGRWVTVVGAGSSCRGGCASRCRQAGRQRVFATVPARRRMRSGCAAFSLVRVAWFVVQELRQGNLETSRSGQKGLEGRKQSCGCPSH